MSMETPDETGQTQQVDTDPIPEDTGAAPPQSASVSQAATLLMGVKLPIRILLGRAQLSLRQITQLAGGSIVELDCSPDDPVEILVNDRVIAHGEVVVVSGNYGVRITRLASRSEPPPAGGAGADLLNLSERLK